MATKICKVDGCDRNVRANRYCFAHYEQWRKTGNAGEKFEERVKHVGCKIDGCERKHHAKGYCVKHWKQSRRQLIPYATLIRYCKVRGCTEKHHVHDMCKQHYSDYCKKRAVEYMGGCCKLCGYSKHFGALQFHHVNPAESGKWKVNHILECSWGKVKEELDKCIMLCANCHFEIHHKKFELERVA